MAGDAETGDRIQDADRRVHQGDGASEQPASAATERKASAQPVGPAHAGWLVVGLDVPRLRDFRVRCFFPLEELAKLRGWKPEWVDASVDELFLHPRVLDRLGDFAGEAVDDGARRLCGHEDAGP